MEIAPHIHHSSQEKKAGKNPILKCACKENILFKEGEEIILKCRILKIVGGEAWAKCKQCSQWVLIPLRMVQ